MSTTRSDVLRENTTENVKGTRVDTKLEVILVPVSNVDRAKELYSGLGWRLDVDFDNGNDFRIIQFTPPGSGFSIAFGRNVTAAIPGSAQGLLVVSDIEAARTELIERGVGASEVFHCSKGFGCRFPGRGGRVGGVHPERLSYGSFLSFSDPDGNDWQLQEVTSRLPGRLTGETAFMSSSELSAALTRAAAAHGHYEKGMARIDPNWADWCAEYMVREQKGETLRR